MNPIAPVQRASQEVKDAQMFREKMASVSEWMGRVKLPRELKAKIRAYYAEVGTLPIACYFGQPIEPSPLHATLGNR